MSDVVRVLYVDDEPDLLDIGKQFLEMSGQFTVETRTSAREGLALLNEQVFDAIISDYQMPGMDGIGFLRMVRSSGNTIPFILFTGRGREEVVIEAINNGADFYLQKGGAPVAQFAELEHKVRQAVRQRQVEESLRTSEARMRYMLGFYEMARQPETELLAYAIEGAGAVTASPLGYLAFLSADESELSMYAWSKTAMEECSTREKPLVYRVEQTGLWGEAVRQRIPVITNNYAAPNPKKKGCPEGHPRIIRHMNVPILDGGHIVIVAGVANKASAYTDHDVRQLTLLMQGLWQVLTRRRTEEELRTAHEQLTASGEDLKANLEELTRQDRLIRESESRLRSFFDTTRDSVMIIDEEGILIEWNAGSERVSGILKNDAIGRYWWDVAIQLVPRERRTDQRRADLEQAIRTALSTGIPVYSGPKNTEIERPDGTRAIIRQTVFPIRTEKGYWFGAISQDITAEKAMEDAFRESGERFRTLVETSPDMIWEIDPAGNFRYISARVSDILGYDPAVLVGKPVTVLIPEHAWSSVMQEIGTHAASRSGLFTVEVPARHRDGRELTIEIRSAPVTDATGTLTGLRGVAHDITARKKTLSALADSEELYRKLVSTVPDIVVRTDLAGNIVYINEVGVTLSGYAAAGEIEGRPVFGFFSPEDLPRAIGNTELMFTGPLGPVGYTFVSRDGKKYLLEINGDVLRTPAGEPYGMVYVGRDITGRKNAEEALPIAYRQLTLLSGITRHDILNNITVILGFLSLAKTKSSSPEMASFIQKILDRTLQIQDQIEFTRVYENLGSTAPRWQDLHAVLVKNPVPPGILVSDAGAGIEIYADIMFGKVFSNLIDNSVRHGERVTTIGLFVQVKEKDLVIRYEDNGTGIPADEKEKIFQRGFGKNTGLGLFLVREILSITGITIRETGGPGTGARFEITVPKGAWRYAKTSR